MRDAVERLREQRDQEREQDEKQCYDLKDKHERLREEGSARVGHPRTEDA